MTNFKVGDCILPQRQIPNIPYPTGVFTLCRFSQAMAYLALVSENKKYGLYAIDSWYLISMEDLACFTPLGETAFIPPPSPEALEQ